MSHSFGNICILSSVDLLLGLLYCLFLCVLESGVNGTEGVAQSVTDNHC